MDLQSLSKDRNCTLHDIHSSIHPSISDEGSFQDCPDNNRKEGRKEGPEEKTLGSNEGRKEEKEGWKEAGKRGRKRCMDRGRKKRFPGVGRNTFLSSPHLCFIIVFICDLFVSRDDPLMSWKTSTRTEQLYVLSHDRS